MTHPSDELKLQPISEAELSTMSASAIWNLIHERDRQFVELENELDTARRELAEAKAELEEADEGWKQAAECDFQSCEEAERLRGALTNVREYLDDERYRTAEITCDEALAPKPVKPWCEQCGDTPKTECNVCGASNAEPTPDV